LSEWSWALLILNAAHHFDSRWEIRRAAPSIQMASTVPSIADMCEIGDRLVNARSANGSFWDSAAKRGSTALFE